MLDIRHGEPSATLYEWEKVQDNCFQLSGSRLTIHVRVWVSKWQLMICASIFCSRKSAAKGWQDVYFRFERKTWHGVQKIFKPSKNKYLRHQWKIFKGSNKIYSFFLRWCSVLAHVCHFQILWSLNLPVLQSYPLVPWSLGPLVLWSLGPLVLVLRSLGPLVFWSLGPSVLWWLWCLKTFWR